MVQQSTIPYHSLQIYIRRRFDNCRIRDSNKLLVRSTVQCSSPVFCFPVWYRWGGRLETEKAGFTSLFVRNHWIFILAIFTFPLKFTNIFQNYLLVFYIFWLEVYVSNAASIKPMFLSPTEHMIFGEKITKIFCAVYYLPNCSTTI